MGKSEYLRRAARSALLASFFAGAVCSFGGQVMLPASAEDESSVGYYSPGYKPITNDQIMDLSQNTPTTYLFRAELAIKSQNWNQAIVYLRKSMKGDDDDIDTHKFLALCLEQKLGEQIDRDPQLFKECVKEWLIVARNLKGPEKGLSFKNGVSPTNNKKWDDEEGAILAYQHLSALTGTKPKPWETNKKYIARVTTQAEATVSAKVLPKKQVAEDDDFR